MKVQRLTLRNFRNVEDCGFEPDPHLNFLVGKNGQGKTSFLEALGFLATLRSFRGAKTEEVIRYGQETAEVLCSLVSDPVHEPDDSPWRTDLKLVFNRVQGAPGDKPKTSKVAFINGKPFKSSTSYLSQRFGSYQLGFHTVVFNPSDHDLVRAEPALRRAYLDRVIAAEDVEYLKTLSKYQRTLEQRNSLLRAETRPPRALLAGFSEPLAKYGALLVHRRLEWLRRLAERLGFVAHQIAPRQPKLQAIYLSNWVPEIGELSINNKKIDEVHFAGQGPVVSIELLEQAFWTKLSVLEQVELEARTTLIGPHRDDWAFYTGSEVGRILRGHGSQGEVRSALLALKLSEIELFRERTGHRPLFLLDDFSSELDRERRAFLLRFLADADLQVFVTTTEDTVRAGKRFQVSDGKLFEAAPEPGAPQSELNDL